MKTWSVKETSHSGTQHPPAVRRYLSLGDSWGNLDTLSLRPGRTMKGHVSTSHLRQKSLLQTYGHTVSLDYSQEQEAHVLAKQPSPLWTGLMFSIFFLTLTNGHPSV